ncbi:MAG: ABC transporter ATP-binding protein [Bacillota bacterium]
MAGIRVDAVGKSFGRVRALDGVHLEVRDREFVVLLGPSGCGKTTLLRIIAGLETPDAGRVRIGERDVTRLAPRHRGIAMVFQNYAIFPHMNVFENIAFGLRMRRRPMAEIKQKVERVAALMHIHELLSRYPGQLSGGQRQRVAMARALAVEPEVLLMDEPLSNLDALLRLEMRAELKRLLQELRTTTLYVTHDQVEAMSLADRIAVMQAGRIVQYDSPLKVYREPVNTFVGGFIGSPPMNFLQVSVVRRDGKTFADVGHLRLPVAGSFPRDQVLLGIRPEDMKVETAPAPDALESSVLVVEPLGSHLLLTLKWNGQRLKVTVPEGLAIAPGDIVWARLDPARVRWMDPKTGQSLSQQGGEA